MRASGSDGRSSGLRAPIDADEVVLEVIDLLREAALLNDRNGLHRLAVAHRARAAALQQDRVDHPRG